MNRRTSPRRRQPSRSSTGAGIGPACTPGTGRPRPAACARPARTEAPPRPWIVAAADAQLDQRVAEVDGLRAPADPPFDVAMTASMRFGTRPRDGRGDIVDPIGMEVGAAQSREVDEPFALHRLEGRPRQ